MKLLLGVLVTCKQLQCPSKLELMERSHDRLINRRCVFEYHVLYLNRKYSNIRENIQITFESGTPVLLIISCCKTTEKTCAQLRDFAAHVGSMKFLRSSKKGYDSNSVFNICKISIQILEKISIQRLICEKRIRKCSCLAHYVPKFTVRMRLKERTPSGVFSSLCVHCCNEHEDFTCLLHLLFSE